MNITAEVVASDSEAFPLLDQTDLATACEAGETCTFRPGDIIIKAGTRNYDCFFICAGKVCIVDVSGDEEREVVIHHAGQFIGDLDLLTGRPGVVDVRALTEVKAARIRSADIRSFLVHYPSIGDRMMSAFIRRRELLQKTDFEGIRLYGHKDCDMTLNIQEFFYRNGVPHTWKDVEQTETQKQLEKLQIDSSALPVLYYGSKEIFRQPTLPQIAEHIGIQRKVSQNCYDVVIIGAGPSGLGAAVYASSEGLSTLVIDNIGPGGQAGSSSKIENYAGFPAGLSGRELALRAYLQALKFGTQFVAPCTCQKISRDKDDLYSVTLCTGEVAKTKTIIISTGISYRKLQVDGMQELEGAGIFYNATQVEAILCKEKPVHVIGAGNSAGQAAMYLSGFAQEVNLLIRGDTIQKGMSEYLWSRVEANPKIKIRYQTEMKAVQGNPKIETIHIIDKAKGKETEEPTSGVFIFIGGEPCTDFLPDEVALDEKGFVLTGIDVVHAGLWKLERCPCELETAAPGIFTSGDCRSGTTKRVAFAIGDGALAITCVHEFLGTYT